MCQRSIFIKVPSFALVYRDRGCNINLFSLEIFTFTVGIKVRRILFPLMRNTLPAARLRFWIGRVFFVYLCVNPYSTYDYFCDIS